MAGPRLNQAFVAQQAAARRRRNAAIHRVYASDSGVGTEGGGNNLSEGVGRVTTFTADAIIVAAPRTRAEALTDLAAFGGGGYVGHVVWQMMGQRGWLGDAVGAVIGVYWIRRMFPRE